MSTTNNYHFVKRKDNKSSFLMISLIMLVILFISNHLVIAETTWLGYGSNQFQQLNQEVLTQSNNPIQMSINGLTPTEYVDPSTAVQVSKVLATSYNSFILSSNGKLYGSGKGKYVFGSVNVETVSSSIEKQQAFFSNEQIVNLAGRTEHFLALTNSGKLYAWGKNNVGQLGDGSLTDKLETPIVLQSAEGIKLIIAGNEHSFYVTNNNNVYGWGSNQHGQLGQTVTEATTTIKTPTKIDFSFSTILQMSAGKDFTLILTQDQKVYAFGNNEKGQLGLQNLNSTHTPTQIPLNSVSNSNTIKKIATGNQHSMILLDSGDLYAFGDNTYGQLALGFKGSTYVSKFDTPMSVLNDVNDIALGSYVSVITFKNGTVKLFGKNYEEAGSALKWVESTTSPLPNALYSVSVGDDHLLYVVTTSKFGSVKLVYVSGKNSYGQVGDGSALQSVGVSISGFKALATGNEHVVAISETDSTLYSWGSNQYGQLGNGLTQSKALKSQITSTAAIKFKQVSAGLYHTLALTEAGEVYAFGNNENGQVGTNDTLSIVSTPHRVLYPGALPLYTGRKIVEVCAGPYHSLALSEDGLVYSWGKNDKQQLGRSPLWNTERLPEELDSYLTSSNIPKMKKLAAGLYHSVALSLSGNVFAWGSNENGQLGTESITGTVEKPTQIQLDSSIVITKIVAGDLFTAILSSTGDVYVFGKIGSLQSTTPKKLTSTNVKDINANGAILMLTTSSGLYALGSNNFNLFRATAKPTIPTSSDTPFLVVEGKIDNVALQNQYVYLNGPMYAKFDILSASTGTATITPYSFLVDTIVSLSSIPNLNPTIEYLLYKDGAYHKTVTPTTCSAFNCIFSFGEAGTFTVQLHIQVQNAIYIFPTTKDVSITVQAIQSGDIGNIVVNDDFLRLISSGANEVMKGLADDTQRQQFLTDMSTKIVPSSSDTTTALLSVNSLMSLSTYTNLLTSTAVNQINSNMNQFTQGLISNLQSSNNGAALSSSQRQVLGQLADNSLQVVSNLMDYNSTTTTSPVSVITNIVSVYALVTTGAEVKRISNKNLAVLVVTADNAKNTGLLIDPTETNAFSVPNLSSATGAAFGVVKYTKSPVPSKTSSTNGVLESNVKFFNEETFKLEDYTYDIENTTTNSTSYTVYYSMSVSKVLQFRTLVNGNFLKLENLNPPLEMTFSTSQDLHTLVNLLIDNARSVAPNRTASEGSYASVIQCRYFDETSSSWSSKGCSNALISGTVSSNTYEVKCSCDHTTMFNAFLDYVFIPNPVPPINPQYVSMESVKGAEIALSSVYIVLISIVLVPVVIFFRKQPIKSRQLVPFISLPALLIESIFVGIITSAVYISSKSEAPTGKTSWENILDVATLFTCVLILTSVFAYFVNIMKYIIYRHLYEILSLGTKETTSLQNIITANRKKITWYRRLTKITTLSAVIGTAFAIFCIYFIVFVILSRVGVITGTVYGYITSVTVFVLVLLMSAGIAVAFLLDMMLSKRHVQLSQTIKSQTPMVPTSGIGGMTNSKGEKKNKLGGSNEFVTSLRNHFIVNDTLKYRLEACIYAFAILCFIISYILYFASLPGRYDTASTSAQDAANALQGVRLIFQFGFIISLIFVYGGFSLIFAIIDVIKVKKLGTDKVTIEKLIVLCDSNNGFELFKQYCKQEFRVENLFCFMELREMKGLLNDKNTLFEKTRLISERYFDTNAAYEVNVPGKSKQLFVQLVKNVKEDRVQREHVSKVLDEALTQVALNLQDIMSRFVMTDAYQSFEKGIEMKTELEHDYDVLGIEM
ncbi:hypothetical protein ABK040_014473 [Willaertia magna]